MCTTTNKATLLANSILNKEMRRTLHAFAADLVGSRRAAIAASEEEITRKIVTAAFNVAYEKLQVNPFENYVPIIVSNKEFETVGNATEFSQALTLIENVEDVKALLNEVNASIADTGMTVTKLEVERISKGLQFIKTSIRFE